MIIPIGHEQETVRRLPWVTFGIMIVCCVAFVLSGEAGNTHERDRKAAERALPGLQYYLEHPYLEIDGDLRALLFAEAGGAEESLLEIYRAEFPPPEDAETLREEQRELDRLTAAALEGLGEHPYLRWGLVPARISPPTLVTHMFLHAGILHLLGNMLILYLGGPFIEDVWGRPLFAGFYLLSGVAAAAAHVVLNAGSTVPLIGASGAIAGVMGAFLVRYHNTKIRFFYVFGVFWRGTFDASAWIMLPLWFGEQLAMATMLSGASAPGGGVAYWAHVGGFVFGAAAAIGVRRLGLEERIAEQLRAKTETELVRRPEVDRALSIAARGDAEGALAALAEQTRLHPDDVDVALALWGVAVELHRTAEAAPAMARAIRGELRRGHDELALLHWDELTTSVPGVTLDPDSLVRIAHLLHAQNRPSEALAALRRAMLAGGTGMPAALALRIARQARRLDPRLCQGAARLALSRPDLDPLEREQAASLLARLAV